MNQDPILIVTGGIPITCYNSSAMNMKKKPYFIWDYDLSDEDVRNILSQGSEEEKKWAMVRILEHAHFTDVFTYLSIKDIRTYLPRLKMRPVAQQYWQRALDAWGYPVHV